MGVLDFVADDFGKNKIGVESFLLRHGDFTRDLEIFSDIRHLPNPAKMFFRNDLRVSGRLRMNVQKSQKIFILVDFVRRNFSADYFAKNAVVHELIITPQVGAVNSQFYLI